MLLSLSIKVGPRSVDVMKGFMTRTLPDVKSMHRCEALARGLGYRTYAALLAARDVTAVVDSGPFDGYLTKHGFEVARRHLFAAAALSALHDVADAHPGLTVWGIGIGEYQRTETGRFETRQSYLERMQQARHALTSDASTGPFLLSLALVQRLPFTGTVRPGPGSYRLKHIAENYACKYPGGEALGPQYVPNGLLIAAACHAGFKFKGYRNEESGLPEVNVSFNMPKRAIVDLDCEIRPDGAAAQDRASRAEWRRQFRPPAKSLNSTHAEAT
ncbi:MAG: hypothetical protein JNL14_14645 [Devosia sp.]|uniref:hypothetical protein n=1 Tax=Devosia sp. TaxID=1871048 RepID=UPI001A4F488F|nr:hypothetical protein [Devosia sp.]MBL8598971.1 hypothetical protein [Devosia sp.]